jgi:hypothetical protein
MNHGCSVPNDLNFDMTGTLYKSFCVKVAVTKSGLCFASTSFKHSGDIIAPQHCAHSATAPPGNGLNHDCAVLGKKIFGFFERRRSLRGWD